VAGSVRDIDKGWKSIVHQLSILDNNSTKIGILKGTTRKDGSSMVKIASINEFGSKDKKIPSRPAHRFSFDKNLNKIKVFEEKVVGQIFKRKIRSKAALKDIGEFHTKNVKNEIIKLKIPANADSTIRQKGFDNPLIETKQMLNSVDHKETI